MVFLLDVNVLLALAWPSHVANEAARRWFARNSHARWATCPVTECAFLRIISNPSFSPEALTMSEAQRLLENNLKHPGHHFWADDLDASDALRQFRLVGHQQITDAYLLALAVHKRGKFATFDKSIRALIEPGSRESSHLEFIPNTSI